MKTKQRIQKKKQNGITRLFLQAITCRMPLPVTEIIVYTDDTAYPVCPRCSMGLEREYMAFCDRCGQKLGRKCFAHTRVVRPSCKTK